MQNTFKLGTRLCTEYGETVTLLAADFPDILAAEETDGTVCFFLSPHSIDGILKSARILSLCVTKAEFYAVLDETVAEKRIPPENTQALVSALHDRYYRIPPVLLRLVVLSYQRERKSP